MSRENQKETLLQELNRKPLTSCFLLITIPLIVILLSSSFGDNQTNTSNKQSVTEITSGPAFMLASMQIGYNDPPAELTSKFDAVLSRLRAKCPSETKKEIANYTFIAYNQIKSTGREVVLLDVIKAIEESFPQELTNSLTCAEVAAAFATVASN